MSPLALTIAHRRIGARNPCFIIGEAGVNHNGDIKRAHQMIDVAFDARVDAIKFQTFTAKHTVTRNAPMASYQKKNTQKQSSQQKLLEEYELSFNDFVRLKEYSNKKSLLFLTTPQSPDVLDFVDTLVPAFKIASGDLTNLPFLKEISKKKKPIILSTGMGTIPEIREAIATIAKYHKKILLLHCTTEYPCHLDEVNLKAIKTLQDTLHTLVGYSDHTEGTLVAPLAVAFGAVAIEKHFTLDKNLPGPDHRASLDPQELKTMVAHIRDAELAIGTGIKKPTPNEKKLLPFIRKSIVALVDIKKGAILIPEMFIIKRPGTGIAPKLLTSIVNKKKARTNIQKDTLLSFKHIESII